MKPLVRFCVSLLLLCALLKGAQPKCDNRQCSGNEPGTLKTDTKSISLISDPTCNLSSRNDITGQGSLSNLTPGAVYPVSFSCFNCCKEITTKPEVVENLNVNEITTSSVFLTWTKPNGNSSLYRVYWTSETSEWKKNTSETNMNITGLTAGVKYTFTVSAVADDGHTEGENSNQTLYTRPGVVKDLQVHNVTTSSMFLTWTKPEGQSSFYKVQWTNEGPKTVDVTETFTNITGLTAGVQYEVSVTAVAGDNKTEGESTAVSRYTKPGTVGSHYVSVTNYTISLKWIAPPGQVSEYRVNWHNGGTEMSSSTNSTLAVLSDLIPGTTYMIQITAVNGALETGEPYIFTVVTKPAVVNNLIITEVTTTSVTLKWTKPEGSTTSYIVQWLEGVKRLNDSTNETSFTINGLTPGYKYYITVVAVSESPSNTGEGTSTSAFTKPVKPVNITVGSRGTDNLNIMWALSEGRVDRYVVNISNKDLMFSNSSTSKDTTVVFTGLYPGRVFAVTVTAEAGTHREISDESQFATYPTPPGAIVITHRTNSSLHLGWPTPALMENAPDISYHVTYVSSKDRAEKNESMVNKTDLSPLLAGTSYNISVKTVGAQGLTSSAVHTSTFTSPNPVLNLISNPKSISSLEVTWSPPQEQKVYYTYYVQTYSPTGTSINRTVSTNSADLSDLESGTRYNISVRTIAAPGIESTEEFTSSYTIPTAVMNVTVENVTTTSIQLSWSKHDDNPSYSYLVSALHGTTLVHNDSTKAKTYTFTDLCPGRLYTFKVITEVDGVNSSEADTTSYTKPAVVSDISVTGDTTNLSVSWTAAECQVESYTVRLLRDKDLVGSGTNLSNTTVKKVFEGLKPGVLYCAEVITESGPFQNKSQRVCNATFPNPPGPITVVSQTVDSINFTWSLPENMDYMHYNFSVTTSDGSSLTTDHWFLLKGRQSGSPHDISVVTVGVNNFESTEVTARNYTRPYPAEVLAEKTEINPTTVTLFWEQKESKPHYSYVVKVSNNAPPETVVNTTKMISGLLSGTNYSFTVTTQTEDGTQADPQTVSLFTRPYAVRHLQAKTLNTSAVHLSWTDPMEYKSEYRYQVETKGCDTLKNISSTANNTVISELTQGTECTFCVFVRAGDGIEGKANCTSKYTEPETVQPGISSQGSNSSVLVSWTKPPGRVEGFNVSLNGTSEPGIQLNSSATSYLFEGLSAGRVYVAMVSTLSGPFKKPSAYVTNATFPNPPGPISVLEKTTSSIEIEWEGAPQMSGASFFYQLTNISAEEGNFISTTTTSHTFTSLLSGTSYNISVATVGALSFQSAKVYRHMVTTRPFGVRSVRTTEEEEIIKVTWDNPVQYKDSYQFILIRQSSEGNVSGTAKENAYNFTELVPGSPYNISVTTKTADGTQSGATWKSVCTQASPVTDFVCEGPNKPNAEVILTWKCPRGQYASFKVYVDDNDHSTSSQCNHTVPNLHHYTEYKLTVETQSCGPASSPQTLHCRTGITDPPPPGNLNSLVKVMEKQHDKFTLHINSSMLNNTNGPIRYVGVLLMNENSDTSDFRNYLEKTHAEWDAGNTPAYLATVREINLQTRSEDAQLVIVVGDSSIWEGYTNGALKSNRNYQFAIVLFTDLKLQSKLVNGAQSLVSITQINTAVFLPVNPAVIGLAVGATLGIFCIFFIVLIGFIIYWRRISKKESSNVQAHSMRAKSVAVRVEDFEAYYKKQKADSNCGFAEEFEDLKTVGTGQPKTNALAPENKSKNRYNNVLPYDSSRVKLSIIHGSPHDDYINANYMPGYNSEKEFIAAQGPLPQTVNEFWRMIWEKNVQTLVMLTRCNEQGRVKCEQYWEHGTKHFENIIVTMTSEISLKDWTIRDFDVKNVKTAETRSVRHFHFTAWPDHGVPETTELLISFRHLVREHMDQYSRHSPTVVHCSAGVGRTGTLIAIDRLINQIERDNTVDVYGIVHDLRMHRPLMVQTEDQYVFLNQCALDIIRSRTGTNVDLIYQNIAAISIYENVEPKKGRSKNGY